MHADELQRLTASLSELATQLGDLPHREQGPLWLALDQGGHASRALVFDNQGRQVAQAYAAIGTQHIGTDRVEHDAEEIVQSLRRVIYDVAHSLGTDAGRVQAAGLATQRSSIVCWDARDGHALSPVLSWQDRRNVALTESLHIYRDAIQQQTGLVLSPHYGASKLRWCLDELPAVQTACQQGHLQCGPLASYLLHELLNERPHVVDPANASRTQLWSPTSGDWSTNLLEWFGVPLSILPHSVTTRYDYGSLPFAGRTLPLRVCTGDQAAVPFANGPLRANTIYTNLGTGAFVLAPTNQNIEDAAPLLRSVLCSDATHITYALEGTVNGAGSALSWWSERTGIDVWRSVNTLHRANLGSMNPPLFINAVGGIAAPYWLPEIESRFIDATANDELGHLMAIVESIAFLLNANLELMRRHLPELHTLLVGGGLSACSYLCECLADLSQLTVMRLTERELTGRGLAYLVAGEPDSWRVDPHSQVIMAQTNPALLSRQSRWRMQLEHYRTLTRD
ncbi:MAG: FGGY family carbohydrate kinase [Steroidobacteraceae bacterium]